MPYGPPPRPAIDRLVEKVDNARRNLSTLFVFRTPKARASQRALDLGGAA